MGKAVRVGSKVTTVKVGDRVGVGAQIWADLTCDVCKEGHENYCPQQVGELPVLIPHSPRLSIRDVDGHCIGDQLVMVKNRYL